MIRIVLAGLAGMLLATAPALAQLGSGGLGPIGAPSPKAQQRRQSEPAPPALPGARAEPTAVAPSERVAADMPPTEALFDAINRGDLAAAKDALARGADLHGRNVLGLTPTELAVDLGRNNISFLLLSLRGGAGYGASAGPGAADAAPPTPAERRAADRAERQARLQSAREARLSVAAPGPVAPRTARLFAGDGGAPAPQAGFLGFDPAR